MKNTTLARALAATVLGLAALSAQAAGPVVNDANYPGPSSLESNTTRAQVRAELARARAAGEVYDDAHYPGPFPQTGAVTREQVRAELAEYKAQGLAFNDATYPVPTHNVPRPQAKPHTARLASSGAGALYLP